jgi:hypothetical protein
MLASVSTTFASLRSVPSTIALRCAVRLISLPRVSLMDSDNRRASLRASPQVAPSARAAQERVRSSQPRGESVGSLAPKHALRNVEQN